MTRLHEINNKGEVVMFCKSGKRSKSMVFMLQKQHGLAHIQQLEVVMKRGAKTTNHMFRFISLVLKGIAMGA